MNIKSILQRILVWTAVLAVVVAVVGGVVGFMIGGMPGLWGAIIGTVLALLFGALTALSLMLAINVSKGNMISGAFFGIVLGGWLLKFVVFIALIFVVRDLDWVNPIAAFISIVVAIVGSLAVDMTVIIKARQPIIDEEPVDESTWGRPSSRN